MPLRRCMREHTHREYLTWIAWLDEQWGKPSRSDNYLMQIAVEVQRVLSKSPNSIQLKHKLLRFVEPVLTTMAPEAQVAASKAKWFAVTGKHPS